MNQMTHAFCTFVSNMEMKKEKNKENVPPNAPSLTLDWQRPCALFDKPGMLIISPLYM